MAFFETDLPQASVQPSAMAELTFRLATGTLMTAAVVMIVVMASVIMWSDLPPGDLANLLAVSY